MNFKIRMASVSSSSKWKSKLDVNLLWTNFYREFTSKYYSFLEYNPKWLMYSIVRRCVFSGPVP